MRKKTKIQKIVRYVINLALAFARPALIRQVRVRI